MMNGNESKEIDKYLINDENQNQSETITENSKDEEIIPDEIKSLVPLQLLNIEKLLENEDKKCDKLKCCNEHEHVENCEGEEQFYVLNCGHCICENCKIKEIDRCSACDLPFMCTKKILVENECAICKNQKATTVNMACGHMCLCYESALKCTENDFKCPIFNNYLDDFRYMFDNSH